MKFKLYWFPLLATLMSVSGFGNQGIYPLNGYDHSAPVNDLKPFDSIFRSAKIVAVSESQHDSRNYIRMQLRLLKYGVERYQVRLVLYEAPFAKVLDLNQFLLHARTEDCVDRTKLRASVNQLNPYWVEDVSVLQDHVELVSWICQFNVQHPKDRIQFLGFDIWEMPYQTGVWAKNLFKDSSWAIQKVQLAIDNCAIGNTPTFKEFLAGEDFKYWQSHGELNPAKHKLCDQSLKSLMKWTKKHEFDLQRTHGAGTIFRLNIVLNSWLVHEDSLDLMNKDFEKSSNVRDEAQFHTITKILKKLNPGHRVMVFTHNAHATYQLEKADWWNWGTNFKPLGSYLKQRFGGKYKSIAQTGYDVASPDLQCLKPDQDDSLDLALFRAGYDVAFLESNGGYLKSRKLWRLQNENSKMFPNGVVLDPSLHFDGIIFHRSSPASLPYQL